MPKALDREEKQKEGQQAKEARGAERQLQFEAKKAVKASKIPRKKPQKGDRKISLMVVFRD